MASLDAVSIGIFLGALLVLAGIMSSLVALRFGAPLLLVFLLVGMLAGEGGPGGIVFDDVRTTYVVGSIALALILFDGGLRTRLAHFRNVLAPAATLATLGVAFTAALTAPVAKYLLDLSWTEALLAGSVVASTAAAAVFFLLHARGLRLRPRVAATLEVESGGNDPFAVLMTILLVEYLIIGDGSWQHVLAVFAQQAALGTVIGILGARAIVFVINRLALAQGLHAPFVTTSALVIFGLASSVHASGFLAVYLAGLAVGNRPTRAHNTVVVFLDAATWLAQIVMFVLLGLLVWPARLMQSIWPALAIAAALMLVARPLSVFLCLAPFRFSVREKTFISWVGLRGAVGIFLASIPLLVGVPHAYIYFDIAFVVVLSSLLIQGWTIAWAARVLRISFARQDPLPRRVDLDLPGRTGDCRLSGAGEQPLSQARNIAGVGAADSGGARGEDPQSVRSPPSAGRRLRLPAGPAGEGAGARSLLRRYAAAARPRSAPARRLLRVGRRHARRAGGNLWPYDRPRERRNVARLPHRA
jgi:potassium/hydrogen antiporter